MHNGGEIRRFSSHVQALGATFKAYYHDSGSAFFVCLGRMAGRAAAFLADAAHRESKCRVVFPKCRLENSKCRVVFHEVPSRFSAMPWQDPAMVLGQSNMPSGPFLRAACPLITSVATPYSQRSSLAGNRNAACPASFFHHMGRRSQFFCSFAAKTPTSCAT